MSLNVSWLFDKEYFTAKIISIHTENKSEPHKNEKILNFDKLWDFTLLYGICMNEK